jgi:hypothetical protein
MHFLCHVAKAFEIKGLHYGNFRSPFLVRHVWTLDRTSLVHIATQRTITVRGLGRVRADAPTIRPGPTTL